MTQLIKPNSKNISIENTNITKLYCLSGLGTDERAFIHLNIENVELIHIPWIENLDNETLREYAQRLFDHVKPEDNYNLLGISFGGMIAAEWEKIRAPKNLFLVSTVSDKTFLPQTLKVIGKLNLQRVIPISMLKSANFFSFYLFGIKSDQNRKLFQGILQDANPKHLRWAIKAILNWSNLAPSMGIRIHGDNDHLIPIKEKIDHVIKYGGHMIIMNEADAIGEIIRDEIFKCETLDRIWTGPPSLSPSKGRDSF